MGLALVRLDEGDRRAGIKLLERILSWNPNDNQGVRLMIGSEYLRADEETKARRVLQEHGAEYPAYRYELGLLHLGARRWAAAATSLRHGFVENPYIAEILCNSVSPMPLPIWHGSNWNEPEAALDYTNRYGALWWSSPEAPRFVRWLHNHPKVMVERAAVLECLQELLWEYDPDARGLILGPGTGRQRPHRRRSLGGDRPTTDRPQRKRRAPLGSRPAFGIVGRRGLRVSLRRLRAPPAGRPMEAAVSPNTGRRTRPARRRR